MKKFLVLVSLFSLQLAAKLDVVDLHLKRANQQLKECFHGGNRAKKDCFVQWQNLTNCIFAEQIVDNPGHDAIYEQINHEYMQAVQRRFNQYNDTITANKRDGQRVARRDDLDLVRQEFYRGLDSALQERRNSLAEQQRQNCQHYYGQYGAQQQCPHYQSQSVQPSAPPFSQMPQSPASTWPNNRQDKPEIVFVEVEKPYFPLLAWLFSQK